jgi:hypothetical protein
MNFIPSLQANYTPVPNSFLQLALSGELGREAVLILLYLFSKSYGWKQEKGFASIQDLVHETSLDTLEATQGIREAIAHEMVLELPLDPGSPDSASMYLLNTLENRHFMEAYATASQEIPIPQAVLDLELEVETPPPRPAGLPEGTMEDPPDMEGVVEDLDAPPLVPETPAPSPAWAPLPDPAPIAANVPYEDWGYTFRTVEMIIRLLGRIPTKDEKFRLQDLGASDGELVEAMGRLIEKKVDIYSSDLIVYEFEAMRSAHRRQQRDQVRKEKQEVRQERQKTCRSCDGLGYVFVGVSGIQECETCKV